MKKKIAISFLGFLSASVVFSANVFAGFLDIKGHWAESTILWAENKEIAGGYPDGSFKPYRSVTEAEFLSLLIRAYNPKGRIKMDVKYHWSDGDYAYVMKKNYPTEGLTYIPKRDRAISR